MMKKTLFLLILLSFSVSVFANILQKFYHADHGPVERLVFVFSEYPRYRLREDPLDVNLSFLDCRRNPEIRTEVFEKQPVITRITFVETDAFIGVLINTYDGYGIEHFILQTDEGYKLVMDVFRYKDVPTASMARDYATFYEKVGLSHKSFYYLQVADSLQIARETGIQHELLQLEKEPVKMNEEAAETVVIQKVEVVQPVVAENEPEPVETAEIVDESPYKKLNQRLPDILKDIYEDKMLMISIIFVALVVIVMILMSVIRKFHRSRPSDHVKPTDKFGTDEFQRVTIKRLLSNGWQVEEIARELNITVEEVEEFGRGN